jgi:hypothetical protein
VPQDFRTNASGWWSTLLQRCRQLLSLLSLAPPAAADEVARARALIAAVDRGGVPLNPAKVNQIARDLGLEVSSRAPVDETIERIRRALGRV